MDIRGTNNLDQLNLMNNIKVEKQSTDVKVDISKIQDVNKDAKQTSKIQEAYKVDNFKIPSKGTLDKMTLLNSLSEISKSQDINQTKTTEQNSQKTIQNIETTNVNNANTIVKNSESSTNNNSNGSNSNSNNDSAKQELDKSIKDMQSTFSKSESNGGFDKSKLQSMNNAFSNSQANLDSNRVQQLLS